MTRGSNVLYNALLYFGINNPTTNIGSLVSSINVFTRAFMSSINFTGNTSTPIPNINWGHSSASIGFQSTNTTNSGPKFWNIGDRIGGGYLGHSPNTSFPFNNTSNLGSFVQTKLMFLATLNFPDLSKLTNYPIQHIPR